MTDSLPPCGLYRTTRPMHDHVPADRLVFFHNHGDQGPGVYLPTSWHMNKAKFSSKGHTVTDLKLVDTLVPLRPEGLYVVDEEFPCCEKECRIFEPDELVQLGYNGQGRAILFVPEIVEGTLAVPDQGTRLLDERTRHLRRLKVRQPSGPEDVVRH